MYSDRRVGYESGACAKMGLMCVRTRYDTALGTMGIREKDEIEDRLRSRQYNDKNSITKILIGYTRNTNT